MNSIKIGIRELGAIKDSSITLSPVMFFSGESGTGKSYLAILCHYFFEVLVNKSRLQAFFKENEPRYETPLDQLKRRDAGIIFSFGKEDLERWMNRDLVTYFSYILGYDNPVVDVSVCLPRVGLPFVIKYRSEFSGLEEKEDVTYILSLGRLNYRVAELNALGMETPFSILLRHHLMELIFNNHLALDESVILPPSRGAFFTEDIEASTGLFDQFIRKMKKTKLSPELQKNVDEEAKKLFEDIIRGRIIENEDGCFYVNKEGVELPVTAVASSIRELLPLSRIINRLNLGKVAVLFEEPEAHLHPALQRRMADLLLLFVQRGMYMQITTHSDHLLRRVNELMLLAKLQHQLGEDDFSAFLKKHEIEGSPIKKDKLSHIASFYLHRRSDGSSEIVRQDLTEGISFQSFRETIRESLRVEDILETELYCNG
jgi:hypothetical protein